MSWIWQRPTGANHWLKVRLRGTVSNRDGIGSWIELWAGGQRQIRYTQCGTSYMGQNSFDEIFGLGNLTAVDSVKVRWPSGQVDVHTGLTIDRRWVLVEGQVQSPTGLAAAWSGPALSVYREGDIVYLRAAASLPQAVEVIVYDLSGRRLWTQSWPGLEPLRLPQQATGVVQLRSPDGAAWSARY
ncbi:MAG: hypothetical protein D6722_27575 [Bacteroidetes bacterium]|nr:MAG: hypothetical protein D6722_27575 [Bacteroidota bacterium]